MKKNIEQRRQPRMRLDGYTANIANDGFVYTATVQDVSLKGMQLQGLPARFTALHGEQFSVVVSDFQEVRHYKLTVHSKWRKKDGRLVAVGFHIKNAPGSWKQFIFQEMPEHTHDSSEEDVWDQYVGARD
ncbi:PilZ domain [Candidatus Electrothrix aarhusensis]|uniref:PilZ domain n=1 Tax=Candidatus Electrothrix aarhusensis TaxID=1859131 RepID=A0A3S3QF08_9BACT|nr:PilZ domain [Candidatus Electrothrix aarhusensis]